MAPASGGSDVLVGSGLRLGYGSTVALAGVDVSVAAGDVLAVTGRSGSGKSSLLYCLAGLVAPDEGSVMFDGVDLARAPVDVRAAVRRRHFGFVFQFAELVPELTLRENIGLPLELNGTRGRARRARVDELVEVLGLAEHADRRPSRVSGGQAQRAAVARAVAHSPQVLFADEPTGALDTQNAELVLASLLTLAREAGTAIVLVTHDERVAERAPARVEMRDGRAYDVTVGGRA